MTEREVEAVAMAAGGRAARAARVQTTEPGHFTIFMRMAWWSPFVLGRWRAYRALRRTEHTWKPAGTVWSMRRWR